MATELDNFRNTVLEDLKIRHGCGAENLDLLRLYSDQPAQSYFDEVYRCRSDGAVLSGLQSRARQLFWSHLKEECPDQVSGLDLSLMGDQSISLFTGAHAGLLLDADVLFSLTGAATALAPSGAPLLWYGCSSVTLEATSFTGPGWLTLPPFSWNLFSLSRRNLAKSSACGHFDNLSFDPRRKRAEPEPPDVHVESHVRALLPGGVYNRPADALRCANQRLWRHCGLEERSDLIQMDCHFVGRLLHRYIRDGHPATDQIIFDTDARETTLKTARRMFEDVNGAYAFPWGTDLFWHVEGRRVRQLRIQEGYLTDRTGRRLFAMEPDPICDALREGSLIPSLFLVFLVLTILPGFTAVGGRRQSSYLPKYRSVLEKVFEPLGHTDFQTGNQLAFGFSPKLDPGAIVCSPDIAMRELDTALSLPLSEVSNDFLSLL